MRRIFLFVLLLSSFPVFSQNGSDKGSISGKIIDAASGNPFEFATVMVLKPGDSSLVSGAVSRKDGSFFIPDLPNGNYIVKITFIGYEKVTMNVNISSAKPQIKLSEITIKEATTELQQVVITGEKPLIENKIDRKVFNVTQSVAAISGTATDVLKQVPSVTVDAEGNISLRGSENFVILINGKPSAISGDNRNAILQQMPASMIENIEIITNPSAKYDPDGMTGIINFNLKKEAKLGWNGSVIVNAGTNNKYNGTASIGYNSGKFNFSASYSERYDNRSGYGLTNKTSWFPNTMSGLNDTTFSKQNTRSTDKDRSHMARLGMDYSFNDKNSIGFTSSLLSRSNNDFDRVNYNLRNNLFLLTDSSFRSVDELGSGMNTDNSMFYIKKFDKKGQELKFNATRSDSRSDRNVSYLQQQLFTSGVDDIISRDFTGSKNSTTTFQADYTHPLNEKSVVEAGAKSIFNAIDNDYRYDSLLSGVWTPDVNVTNHFVYNDQIHSMYGLLRQDLKKFGYQAGLRYEYFTRHFELLNTNESKSKTYHNVYPTVHLQYKLSEKNELQLSYSRRINRPHPSSLNPFIRYYSPLSYSKGNPDLDPEYINSFDLGYLWKEVKNSVTTNIFYRQTTNMFTRVVENVSSTVTMSTTKNISSSSSYGMEVTAIYYVTNWWFLNANSSVFNYKINSDSVTKDKVVYHFKVISNMSIPKIINIQLSGNYRSGMITTQGEMLPFYSVDAGLRKDILKNKGALTLSVSDVFNTMQFRMKAADTGFTQIMNRKRESRIVFVGFTYRFGQQAKKGKQDRQQQDNNDIRMDDNMF